MADFGNVQNQPFAFFPLPSHINCGKLGRQYVNLSHIRVAAVNGDIAALDDVEVILSGRVAQDEILENHVLAVLEIDKRRNDRILRNMLHPDLGGNVIQKGRTTTVNHTGAEYGHILDTLSPEDSLVPLVGIDVRRAHDHSTLAKPDADPGLELHGTRDITSHAELKRAATLGGDEINRPLNARGVVMDTIALDAEIGRLIDILGESHYGKQQQSRQ